MSELLALGISHKTAPVGVRERLALPDGPAREFIGELVAHPEIGEAVAISTCNRTEIYLVGPDPVGAETTALGMLARRADIRPTELVPSSIYSLRNCDVARHLFRVTAGLESMIVGEHEVQGQVKRSYEAAREAGATGPLTNQLFQTALLTGKRVRSETAISEGRVSVSSVAVDLARDVLGDLEGRHVVILGAGETAELTARALADGGVATVFVANRRRERAQVLADRFGGRVVGFDEMPAELERADILVASTSSPHAIVEAEEMELVLRAREGRPLLIVDIAVPRDVEEACRDIDGITLYDMDDLQAVVERNRSDRAVEAHRAEVVIEEEMERFARWLGGLEVQPTVAALRARGTEIARAVLAENDGRWESASPRDRTRIAAIADAIVSRLLHEPTQRLKRTGDDRSHARMQVLRDLFALEDPPAPAAPEQPAAEVRELPRRRAEQ